jgi:hypothetical protein
MATESKILIGIDDQVIELTGEEKEAFLAQRAKDDAEIKAKEAQALAKAEAKAALLARLGITEEEAKLLLA